MERRPARQQACLGEPCYPVTSRQTNKHVRKRGCVCVVSNRELTVQNVFMGHGSVSSKKMSIGKKDLMSNKVIVYVRLSVWLV